jgi:hypothetical protein
MEIPPDYFFFFLTGPHKLAAAAGLWVQKQQRL